MTSKTYPLLTPDSVLFNQLSLKVHLDYQNILNCSLGLNSKPKSVQQAICFEPTPVPFDSFSPPFEYQQLNRLKMYHFYVSKQAQNSAQNDFQAHRNHYQTTQLLRKSEFWRCLMTIYYILNSKQFYDQTFGNPNLRQNRLNFAQSTYNRLNSQEYFYKQILGDQFIFWLTQTSKSPKYTQNRQSQFLEELVANENQYSIIKNDLQSVNVMNYIRVMQDITKLLTDTFDNEKIFSKVQNPFKYLVRFYVYILLNFILFSLILQKYAEMDILKALVFQKTFKHVLNIYAPEQRQHDVMYRTKAKLIQYQNQTRYSGPMKQISTKYQQAYRKMSSLYEKYQYLRDKLFTLETIYKEQSNVNQLNSFYSQYLSDQHIILGREIGDIMRVLKKIIQEKFFDPLNGSNLEVSAVHECKKLRVTLILQTLFRTNLKNLSTIQLMVLPLISAEMPRNIQNIDQFCKRHVQTINYCLLMFQEEDGGQNADQ